MKKIIFVIGLTAWIASSNTGLTWAVTTAPTPTASTVPLSSASPAPCPPPDCPWCSCKTKYSEIGGIRR